MAESLVSKGQKFSHQYVMKAFPCHWKSEYQLFADRVGTGTLSASIHALIRLLCTLIMVANTLMS